MARPFRIGQKVVCINNRVSRPNYWGADIPMEGTVYTVTGYDLNPRTNLEGVLLREIKNHVNVGRVYNPERFRPAVDRPTSIAVFTKILNTINKRTKQKETV